MEKFKRSVFGVLSFLLCGVRWVGVVLLAVASSLSLFAMIPGSRAVGGWVVRRGGRLELVRLARPLVVLLALGLSAAAACDDQGDGAELATCEEIGDKVCECGDELAIDSTCDPGGYAEACPYWDCHDCIIGCDVGASCDLFAECALNCGF